MKLVKKIGNNSEHFEAKKQITAEEKRLKKINE